jgi:hypothetical protein
MVSTVPTCILSTSADSKTIGDNAALTVSPEDKSL